VGTVCESVTSIQSLASNAANVKRSVDGREDSDDVALLNAVREFGKGFARSKMSLHAA
jgi:hypothetical protein